jgi:hypothetical protein
MLDDGISIAVADFMREDFSSGRDLSCRVGDDRISPFDIVRTILSGEPTLTTVLEWNGQNRNGQNHHLNNLD